MRSLTAVLFVTLAVSAFCKPGGWGWGDGGHWGGDGGHWGGDGGHWDDGSWDDGSWDDGSWHGDGGRWGGDGGQWDDGSWGGHGHYSDVVHGNGAVSVGASQHVNGGHGHGIVVRGPPTAPVTIVGPAGKVHAKGLWGPTHKGVHHW